MAHTEDNRINTRGVVPGYDMESLRQYPRKPGAGTQVAASGSAHNAITVIHTVSVGKILYLTSWTQGHHNASGAISYSTLRVRNTTPAIVFEISRLRTANGMSLANNGSIIPALEISASYTIEIYSPVAGVYGEGFITGYEI